MLFTYSGLGLDQTEIMHYVYVLRDTVNDKFYIGYTADIKRRLMEHKSGKVHTTARYTNKEPIFYETFISKEDALRREGYFKTTKGKQALRLILRDSLK